MTRKILIAALLMPILQTPCQAQTNEIFAPNIKTLNVRVNDNWDLPPVMMLGSNDYVEISFDEMSHAYHTYRYRITHCNEDWTVSSLLDIDFLEGFNDNEIEYYATSFNTTTDYTHYSFTLPNEYVSLKASGNYKIEVYDEENPDETLLSACLYVLDHKVNTYSRVSSNTDIDTNVSHQQVEITVNMIDGFSVRQPQRELKVNVMQNRRADNMVSGITPTFIGANHVKYEHVRDLIFPAGNEYRRFEVLNEDDPMMGVSSIDYFEPYYHVTLYEDSPRVNYDYDQDQDGIFIVRNNYAQDNDTEADYMLVHFTLKTDAPVSDGDVYLSGAFTYNRFDRTTRMHYNPQTRSYESVQRLKQGIYNYMYLVKPDSGQVPENLIEGNFYETENEYMIFIYYRPFGERYDRLIGFSRINS